MRLLFEVIGAGLEMARFTNKKNGGIDEVPFYWIAGVDSDYFNQLIKIKIYKPQNIQRLQDLCKKGARLQVKFEKIIENKFEKCAIINARENEIQAHMVRAEKPASQPEQAEPLRQMAIASGE